MIKRFIVKIVVFFALIVVVDFEVGLICRYLQGHSKGGYTYRQEYIVNHLNDSILIFGSSRAIHHYDPAIFMDKTGMSTYNCGLDGNGIIFNYAQWRMLTRRYNPSLLIYDVHPDFDLLKSHNNERYIKSLRYYYDYPGIDSIFYDVDKLERYKMLSNMYRYNGKFIQLLSDYIKPQKLYANGYQSLTGVMEYEPVVESDEKVLLYDPLKLKYWGKLFREKSPDTRIILCVSPYYMGSTYESFKPLIDLATRYGVDILLHGNDATFVGNKLYFKDSVHLNGVGATLFSEIVTDEILKTCTDGNSK